ncbi:MAG TPA: rhomboid family intramembrane serine protease [Verrucomicrobiae bacterium]|nr:rhomboid family intramembrane serine protease [Verrucomicrobiae bacterium]
MIPLRDDRPPRTFALATSAIIAINFAVFFHEISLGNSPRLETFVAAFALTPADLVHGPSPGTYRTVFTSMFLHGGWMHILGNMLFLWVFGRNVEDSIGHFRFVIFYLLCGIAAAAAQVALSPDSTVPMLGASGAISGVLGAYLLLFPRARVLVLFPIWFFWRVFYVSAILFLVFWFGIQLLSGLAVVNNMDVSGGVAFWAHVGGFVAGMFLIPVFKKRGVRLFQ